MDERPKEFPQTGADGSGQVSPQLGSFWLPNQNGGLPDGMTPDFSVPRYEEGVSDIYIPDYHPPAMTPAHPFEVNRYFDVKEEKWKVRVREGRFFLTNNEIKSGTPGPSQLLGPSDDGAGGVTVEPIQIVDMPDAVTIDGDTFPSFGNKQDPSAVPAGALAKEFTNDNAKNGYAFIDADVDAFNPEEHTIVFLRYILQYSTTGIRLSNCTNNLNIVVVIEEDVGDDAKLFKFEDAKIADKNEADGIDDQGTNMQLMRPDPNPAIPLTINGLTTGGSEEDRLRSAVYYVPLARVAKVKTESGPIITQYVYENIYLSVTNLTVTEYAEGYGNVPADP